MSFRSINKTLQSSFKENWDSPALSNFQGMTLTYGELAAKIEQLQTAFRICGISKGDKVAICSRNQANWGVSFLAAMTYGAVPVPILHEFKPGNIHYLVNHSDAKVLFVDDVIWEGLSEDAMPELSLIFLVNSLKCLLCKGKDAAALDSEVEAACTSAFPSGFSSENMDYFRDGPQDLALINYTSGTSGFSKGVMLSYRALYANIYFAGQYAEPQMDSRSEVVSMLPSAHMYGLMFEFLFEMTIGAHVHFLNKVPSPKVIMKAFSEIRPDIIISVPLILEKVYKTQIKPLVDKTKIFFRLPLLDRLILNKFRNGLNDAFGGNFEEIILGGAPFNPEIEAFLRKLHFRFTVGYGMTECAPLITYSKWYKTRKGSCGKPVSGCSVKIDSVNPAKIPGEILIKGDNLFTAYYKNSEATAAAFTEDGWFRTGDMGVMDKQGYLYIKGRCKCMILGPSGQNIYPEELEAMLNNLLYVVDSLVIEDSGALVALIYPDYHQAELDGIDAKQLLERLNGALPEINASLPKYSHIRKMEFLPEDFERTPKKSIKRYLYQRNVK